ncbi:MAG: SPFH domain-containing protein, partial [Marinicella sp.]
MITEKKIKAKPGIPVLLLILAMLIADVLLLIYAGKNHITGLIILAVVMIPVLIISLVGLFMVNPNESKVLQLFGKYVGTASEPGLRWANPFYGKKAVSLRVRNFESGQLKVNDSAGNPIEIATVVVWKVVDTAEAIFEA